MKYMKLGCRPDTFYTAEAVRSVSSEILSDLVIQVKSSRYLLHKFPMLSRCLRLQSLMSSQCPETSQEIKLQDFPGEAEAFELCAKFCYGITITLNAYNIVAVRCAAEYLEMTEEAENGNLIQKLEHFLTSSVFNGWRDSFVTLQTTKALPLWSEDLEITSRCIEAISSKVSANPSKINSSGSCSRKGRDEIYCNGGNKIENSQWWGEDMADLGIDLYWRTMTAIKSSDRNIPPSFIGNALRIYASKWLPNIGECTESTCKKQTLSESGSNSNPGCSKHRLILESVVSLLPDEKGAISCSFLLQLLKISNVLNASSPSKMELAKKAAIQLDEAAICDLLIPLSDKSGMLYDVDIIMTMVKEFQSQTTTRTVYPSRSRIRIEHRRSRSEENINMELQEHGASSSSSSISHGSKVKVAKLVDGYLQEIARDAKLPLQKFIELAEMIPEISRIDHDDIYEAIDVYLKAHPNMEKGERKRLCRILDCKKLSPETSKHAVQNPLLPLRVIVQVLFFEHARAAMAGANVTDLPGNITTLLTNPSRETSTLTRSTTTTRRPSTLRSKLEEEDNELVAQNGLNPDGNFQSTPSRFKAFCTIPRQPKKIFSKLMSINRSLSQRN